MNRTLTLVLSLALSSTAAQALEPPAKPKAADLSWLSGSWETDNGPAHVEEHWTCASADAVIGMGRTVVKGKPTFFEYLRIEERADGVFYVAQPKGRAGTSFKLVKSDGKSAVFENPAHDFPKRILYSRTSDDTLVARVEGDAGSKEKAEEFRYKRIPSVCR